MIRLNRILVPTDFSDFSKHAIRYGCEFANRFGAELHLLHVLQDVVALVPEPGMAFPPPGDYLNEMKVSAVNALELLPDAGMLTQDVAVREVRVGTPSLETVRYAQEHDIDLIVIGTHGRTGLAHVLLGSTAEKVVRKSPCPVLTVRPEGHGFVTP